MKILTVKEHQVADLICEGKTNKEIASILGISYRMARFHSNNALVKLAVHSRAELISNRMNAFGLLLVAMLEIANNTSKLKSEEQACQKC